MGYNIIDGKYVINEAESKCVKNIFNMFIEGESYSNILNYVNKSGIVGKRGKPLGKNSLYSILKNKKYTGIYTYNEHTFWYMRKYCGKKDNPEKIVLKDVIPVIIDEKKFKLAQQRMSKRMKGKSRTRRTYLLSELIECPVCGYKYVGRCSTNKKGIETRYYTCSNKYNTKKCKSKNINAELLETAIIQYIQEKILNQNMDEIIDNIYSAFKNKSNNLEEEKKELRKVDGEIHNILNAIKKGLVFEELEKELARLKLRQNELTEIINSDVKNEISREDIVEAHNKLIKLNKEKDYYSLLHSIIEKIMPNQDCNEITVIIGHNVGNKSCGGMRHLVLTTFTKAA